MLIAISGCTTEVSFFSLRDRTNSDDSDFKGSSSNTAPKLITLMENENIRSGFNDSTLNGLEHDGGITGIIIYQKNGDPDETGTIDLELLETFIKKRVPEGWNSYVMLDFERPYVRWFQHPENKVEFQQAIDQFLSALSVAKKIRPQAKWGFYGLPVFPFGWSLKDPEEQQRIVEVAKAPVEIFEAVDYISSSIYDRTWQALEPGRKEQQKIYATMKMRLAVEVAAGKEVMPTIWHRVHDAGSDYPLKLFPEQELWDYQILPALESGVTGVFWWGADFFHWRHNALQFYSPEEFEWTNDQEVDFNYLDQLHLRLGWWILDQFSSYDP